MASLESSLLQPPVQLWIETPCIAPGPVQHNISAAHQQEHAAGGVQSPLFSFTLQTVGGSASLEGGSHLTWQVENGSAGVLTLAVFSASAGPQAAPVSISFNQQLFPGVVVVQHDRRGPIVVGITADGSLFRVDLLDLAFSSDHHVSCMPAAALLSQMGTPTCLSATPEHLVIGGSQGSVLCLPHACLESPQALFPTPAASAAGPPHLRPILLRESSWGIKSLIAGAWQRPRTPAVVATMHMPAIPGSKADMLLVLYDDGVLRGYNPARQTQLFIETLDLGGGPPGSTRRPVPIFASLTQLQSSAFAASAVLVVQHEATDTLHKATLAVLLSFTAGANRPTSPQQLLLASRADSTLLAVNGQDDVLWLLFRMPTGQGQLLRYTLTGSGQPSGSTTVLEQHHLPAHLAGVTTGGERDAPSTALWADMLASSGGGSQAASNQVAARMLAPGQLCRTALQEALRYHGIRMTRMEVAGASQQQLEAHVAAAVDSIQRRNTGLPAAHCWAQLLLSYQEAWRRAHPLLGLGPAMGSGEGGWLLTLRGGGVAGAVREATVVEALAATAALEETGPAAGQPLLLPLPLVLPAPVAAIATAAANLAALLGPWARDAARAALLAGSDPLTCLAPTAAQLLVEGPGQGQTMDDVVRAQHSAWRRRRQHALLQVSAQLAALPDLATATRQYCSLLHLDPTLLSTLSTQQQAGTVMTLPLSLFLTQAACQVALAQASAAGDALLLVSLIAGQQLLGGSPAAAALLTRQPSLPHQLAACQRRASLVAWLCTSPSTADLGAQRPDLDPALTALASLQLGATSTSLHATPHPRASAGGPTKRASLAARLLPSLAPLLGLMGPGGAARPGQAEGAVARLVLLLQYGPPGEQACPSVESRVLQLGYALFTQREYRPLADLTRLVLGNGVSSCSEEQQGIEGMEGMGEQGTGGGRGQAGMHLLRGLSLACQLGAVQGVEREVVAADAAACFFCAAAGLAQGCSSLLVDTIVGLITHLTGAPPQPCLSSPPSTADEVAALQLQLFEAAMQLFEREGAPAGALAFARAALQHARPAVCSDAMACDESPGSTTAQQAAAMAREGRLWSNVFTYCCALHAWDDAYAALASNPSPWLALDCLRLLISQLCEANALHTLCSLPLAGCLLVPVEGAAYGSADMACSSSGSGWPVAQSWGQQAAGDGGVSEVGPVCILVTLLGEAIAALQRRALNSALTVEPQPYKVLYDLQVSRSLYRDAAATMVAHARRLRAEGLCTSATLQQVLLAYGLAVACLDQVQPSHAWLDLETPWLAAHPLTARGTDHLFLSGQHGTGVQAAGQPGGKLPSVPRVVLTLGELVRERAGLAASAAAHLAGATPGSDPLQYPLDPGQLLSQLLGAACWDEALVMADAMWAVGSSGHLAAVSEVVGAVAGAAARAQVHPPATFGNGPTAPPAFSSATDPELQLQLQGSCLMGSPAAGLWVRLRLLLRQYLGGSSGMGAAVGASGGRSSAPQAPSHAGYLDELRRAAAAAILQADARLALPVWLLQLFTEGPVDAIGRSLDPGLPIGSMAVAACGPASLLELYLGHSRQGDAVELVVHCLQAWGRVDPRARRQHAATWFPHNRIQVLRGRLVVEVERGQSSASLLLAELDDALAAHTELVAHDTPVASQARGDQAWLTQGVSVR